ncbi:MAG: UDP-N-acetylmuramoyl-tripeptide--D-alanyl-D-alanine ligase [Deltaproteobacteria bacterium]|nr:UDP-N-acetylmuramoyl-tripeptide--D-alanyl-D-alanine ligase [Deltaproteobacteria bacterium]
MFELKAKEILEAVKGSLITGDENLSVKGVSTDSRTIKQGEIFFALVGPNFDGNRFIEDVFKKGAGAAVVSKSFNSDSRPLLKAYRGRPAACGSRPIIAVDDTLIALGDLARYWRLKHPLPLIAISGSCGKTTTKEMIASILNTSYCAVKTEGNLNNLIGMPLTLFGINNRHNAAVVELGISEKGEMARLADICMPDVAALTNIGEAHLKTLKNIEGVAYAKGEIFSGLKKDGIAVVNLDDPWIVKIAESVKQKKITFSIKSTADVFLKKYSKDNYSMSAIFNVNGDDTEVKINGYGIHNLSNAAAAIAAGIAIGAKKQDIIDGLKNYKPLHGRMEPIKLENDITVIDDTYNANPASVEASLRSLSEMKGRKIVVLGDMLELGDASKERHRYIGKVAGGVGLGLLFVVGEFKKDVADGAIKAGMDKKCVQTLDDKSEVVSALEKILKKGDILLVKGSRAVGMEEIIERLQYDIVK